MTANWLQHPVLTTFHVVKRVKNRIRNQRGRFGVKKKYIVSLYTQSAIWYDHVATLLPAKKKNEKL